MDNKQTNNPDKSTALRSRKTKKKRRVPVQTRSIQRVDRILDTASELMADAATDKVTTHLIAEKAGVSVGSLYQFFPNVESIKIALIERLLEQYFQHFRATVASHRKLSSLKEFTGVLVDATYNFFKLNPDVVNHIVSCSHTEEFAQVNASVNQRIKDLMLHYFADIDFGLSNEDLDRKITVALTLGDMMTMLIWTAESEEKQQAYLRDWRNLTTYYSALDTNNRSV